VASRTRLAFAFSVFLALGAVPSFANAQGEPAPSSSSSASPSPKSIDTIYLNNGGIIRGRIVEIVPDDHVVIVLPNENKRVAWSEIRRITADMPVRSATVTANPSSSSPSSSPSSPLTPARAEEPPTPAPPPKPHWQPNAPLFIGGACVFGLAYGLTLLVAFPSSVEALGRFLDGKSNLRAGGVALIIPFIGPIIFAEGHGTDSVLNKSGGELPDGLHDMLWVSAVMQMAGGASMIAGLALGGTPAPKKEGAFKPSLRLQPMIAPSTVGLSVNVTEW
jgi:hypothetical protein